MVPPFGTWLLWLVTLSACGSTPVRDEDHGSTVTYEPVRSPDGPPARLPSAPATFIGKTGGVLEVRQGGSVVRYEPILDGEDEEAIDPASPESPIDDDAGRDGHELAAEDRGARGPLAPHHPAAEVDASVFGVHLTDDGLAFPYPTTHTFRGFGVCRGRRHHHEAIDLGGVGKDWGVGTPIRSMARAEVVFIGRGAENPDDFGTPDTRPGQALRGDRMLPRARDIAPYGRVYFFTSKRGRWRSGNLIVTRVLDGPLAGHVVRYLHIAAVHPSVAVGGVIERGQEIALMGGTGVQDSAPHLHLDIQAPSGRRLDVAPLLGLAPTATCRRNDDDEEARQPPERSRLTPKPSSEQGVDIPLRRQGGAGGGERLRSEQGVDTNGRPTLRLHGIALAPCKRTTRRDDFSTGRYQAHSAVWPLTKGQKVSFELARAAGSWKPRLEAAGEHLSVKTLASGKVGSKAVVAVTAEQDTTLALTIGTWSREMPRDAAYELEVSARCRGSR